MLKQTIIFTDYNEEERTKDFYFNLSKAELTEMQIGQRGGMERYIRNVVNGGEPGKIMDVLLSFIKASYGVRSDDGADFIKTREEWLSFRGSGAYDVLFLGMVEDPEKIMTFMREIIPVALREEVATAQETPGFRPGADTSRPTPPADVPVDTQPSTPPATSEPAPTVEPVSTPSVDVPEQIPTYQPPAVSHEHEAISPVDLSTQQ